MGSAEPTGYEAIAQVDRIREEPEKIKKWREEQKIRLEKKGKYIFPETTPLGFSHCNFLVMYLSFD